MFRANPSRKQEKAKAKTGIAVSRKGKKPVNLWVSRNVLNKPCDRANSDRKLQAILSARLFFKLLHKAKAK
jgi:hypothetical protein